jgi:hypothetical protein
MTISRCTRNDYHVRRGSGQAACRPPAARGPFRADLTLAPEGAAESRTASSGVAHDLLNLRHGDRPEQRIAGGKQSLER